ncbi:MAG TPA: DUF2333 family protein [Rickettsiales bacterium]|nr:DUF2333 family protein [Rickettsiales bacterium]
MEPITRIFKTILSWPRYILIYAGSALLIFLLLYYPIGMLWVNHIDDRTDYTADKRFDIEGGSHSVALMEALIDREVVQHHWTPNAPFFYPSHMLIRMPAFQRGMMASLARFAVELSDQIARQRGSSQIDPDLEKAAGLLKYSPNVWVFDLSTSLLPTTPSEDQYIGALRLLGSYNERLAKGQAVFDRRADNLMEALERIATDLGSSSAVIDSHITQQSHNMIDTQAADIFYSVKGRMYVDYLLLRELQHDFAGLIAEKQLQNAWDRTLENLRVGAGISHFMVFNADPSSEFIPNHLAVQGFFLLRARTQLKELSNILLK